MSRILYFNNTPSTDYGIIIGSNESWDAAGRDVEEQIIPGRNGAVLKDNKRYKVKSVQYDFIILQGMTSKAEAFRNFLLSLPLGFRLEDSKHPDEYYEAWFTDEFKITPAQFGHNGTGKFNLRRMPERWLKAGEQAVSITGPGTLAVPNPTPSWALPLYRCYGSGTLAVNDAEFTVTTTGTYTDIDCMTKLIHEGAERRAGAVTRFYWDDIRIPPNGTNVVVTGFTKVEVFPRYYLV